MTRDEHLAWCKKRALEYCDRNDLPNAVVSMLSDLSKHEELKGIADKIRMLGMYYVINGSSTEMRRFIEGFR